MFRKNTAAFFSHGNKVGFYRHGGDFFPALFEALHQANHQVCLQFYIIKDDTLGKSFADLLISAVARGVRVNLIYDYIGCFDTPASYFRRLEKNGVKCLPFNPPAIGRGITWLDRRNHRKFAVIDGTVAFVGGHNVADEYAGFGESLDRWRDVGMRIEGPAVEELQRLFMDSWQEEGGDRLGCPVVKPADTDGCAELMIISGGPHHNRSYISSAFRMAIAGASSSVRILTPYFVPGPRIIRSLLRAAARGVHVQLIVPAVSDVPLVKIASRSFYTPLLRGGIEIYERQGTVLHAKVMLIDGCWATVGSANLDLRSFHRNYEVNVVVDDGDFGQDLDNMFVEDLAQSDRITLTQHEARGWYPRFLERILSPMSWFL